MVRSMLKLTRREVEVARLASRGWPTKFIAAQLGVLRPTINGYLRDICRKMNLKGPGELRLYRERFPDDDEASPPTTSRAEQGGPAEEESAQGGD